MELPMYSLNLLTGAPIPDPPTFGLSVNMVNFVHLGGLTAHIKEHSPGEIFYC